MIKVGHIYKDKEGFLFVITYYDDQWIEPHIGAITQDGYIMKNDMTHKDIDKNDLGTFYELIAEYPSWEEAIRSPEFTGEKETLGAKLKTLRDEKNLSLQDVSNATHISKSYLWDIERDNKTMSVKTLSKLAVFYGVSPNYLLGF